MPDYVGCQAEENSGPVVKCTTVEERHGFGSQSNDRPLARAASAFGSATAT
jgi:hypothetical protein